MRVTHLLALLFVFASAGFAQTNAGTITGTISDPAGAVVANAAIEATNTGTAAVYPVASSTTGNYTIGQLPAGTYELSVTVPGFKKYVRPGLIVQAAQTIRVDAALQVGNASESVTVNEEAPLLKTESGTVSTTIATETMNTLPILVVGANGAGIRNPYNIVALVPGTFYAPPSPGGVGITVRINGGVSQSETVLIDGMDGTNALGQGANAQAQPGQDQIQEWTVQTSNYAAEFGQAGSAVMNVTMKSGTNQYHGSVFESYQNAYLNAGQPFTNNGNGQHLTPASTQNDYGMTFGGPVRIPKVYDGRNRTFFFFNWEQYIRDQYVLGAATTVPTAAYRNGNFSGAIAAAGNRNIGTDPLGRVILADSIYDPTTVRAVNGQSVTDPFPNNTIPVARMSPIALKVQNLLPQPFCVGGPPCNPLGSVNNFQNTEFEHRQTEVPSVKIDHIIGPKDKLSFFWNRTMTYCLTCYGDDGMAQPISGTFGGGIYSKNLRLNYDHTLQPTLLLHLGAGYNSDDLGRPVVTPVYNACTNLGLCSAAFTQPAPFPNFTGLLDSTAGGMQPIATGGRGDSIYNQFNSIASLTWVKGNHTFKFGGQLLTQGNYAVNQTDLQGTYGFSGAQTAMPYTVQTVISATGSASSAANIGAFHIGQPYASFLLGAPDTANIDPPSDSRFGKYQWSAYAQDSWKVTRKLTLDLGLRFDFATYYKEQYGRSPNFAASLANATAGGHPGATEYQSTCNCQFANNYPLAFGPRLGFAYQVLPKTVIRGGFGIVYTGTGQATTFGGAYGSAAASNPFGPSATPGSPVMTLGNIAINGNPLTPSQIVWPNLSSNYYPIGGVLPGTGPQSYDPNGGRPARQYQYSFGVQREIIRDLVVEASYVGNRGIWWATSTTGGALTNLNYLSTSILSQYGLSLNNPADLATLLAPVNSPAAGRFQNKIPFTGFPLTQTVAQSLRPFPQFNSGLAVLSAPLASTAYDGLQVQANKRFSHGFQFGYAFTWSKNLDTFGGTPDVQNRGLAWKLDPSDQPLVSKFNWTYTTPKWGPKLASMIVRDWTITGFIQYASGTVLAPPAANATGYPSNLATATIGTLTYQPGTNPQNLVPGQPLFNDNLNCRCFDPNKTFVLNAAAWVNPGPGQFGNTAPQGYFRGERRPVENMGIGRLFRIKERVTLNLRAEFANVFNRTYLNNPTLSGTGISPQTPPVCVLPNGTNGTCQPGLQIVSGFGSINTTTTAYPPRVGQLVAQFKF